MSLEYNPRNADSRKSLSFSLQFMLLSSGFTLEKPNLVGEDVYSRRYKDTNMYIAVYTTIVHGSVRAVGSDAIRVCAVYSGKENTRKGILKQKRVNRVGTVEEIVKRTLSRMRSSWSSLGEVVYCKDCGAPTLISKSNKRYCADICWTG